MADQGDVKEEGKTLDPAEKRFRWIFFSILLAGILLRLVMLGRASYMIDEINIVRDAVAQESFGDIFRSELERFNWYHRLPFAMVVIRAAAQSIGYTGNFPPEWIARLPFALMGIGMLPLMYLLGRSLRDRTLGLWCMFLATISVYATFYAREAYDYAMVMFCVTGVLWSGIELVKWAGTEEKINWRVTIAYMIFSAGLLQSHLSGLLFLGPFNALMVIGVGLFYGWDRLLKGNRPFYWLMTFGVAYLLFLPFLLSLLGGGFETTEHPMARRFSIAAFPALLGRMGWGESWFVLIPFSAFFIAGLVVALRKKDAMENRPQYILIAIALVLYFIIQSWMLRVSRFETRYYSSIFPILILFAAIGIEWAVARASQKWPKAKPGLLRGVVAVPVTLWLSVSLWSVLTLDCRGYNYKGIANWIMEHVPQNGIYAFYNIYELRGVPNVYPTPGRFGTSVAAWSSGEDYERVNPPLRALQFFSRFPLAFFVEIAPDDLLAPETGVDPIDRDRVLARHVWLEDRSWDRLMSLQTFPPGAVQLNATNAHRVLISYNDKNDLGKLALRSGRKFYHYFGPEWQYTRDGRMNDFRVALESGTIFAGNATQEDQMANLVLHCAGVPNGCRLSIFSPDGRRLLDKKIVPAQFTQVKVDNVLLKRGMTALMCEVLPPPNDVTGQLLVYGVALVEPDTLNNEGAPRVQGN